MEILARGGGDRFDITMFGEEPYGNYNRILLSNVLNGSYQAREIFLNPLEWYEDNNIKLHSGVRAAGIERRAKKVYGEDGRPESYDKLIIATGSRPFIPPIEGVTLNNGQFKPGVFVFRTLDDCRRISDYTEGKARAVVDDSQGIAGQLDRNIEASIAAYRDPWRELTCRRRLISSPRCCRCWRDAAHGRDTSGNTGIHPAGGGPQFSGGRGAHRDLPNTR